MAPFCCLLGPLRMWPVTPVGLAGPELPHTHIPLAASSFKPSAFVLVLNGVGAGYC